MARMRTIDKLSEADDKLLDPRELSFRLGRDVRKRIERLLEEGQGTGKELATERERDAARGPKEELRGLLEKEEQNKQLLDYNSLSLVHKNLQRLDPDYQLYFYQLLDECKALLPLERENKELETRLKRLKYESSVNDYCQMSGTSRAPAKGTATMIGDIKTEIKNIEPSMIALINSVLVIGGTFAFMYKAVEYALPSPNIPAQIIMGMIGATVVAIAELYFLIKYLV